MQLVVALLQYVLAHWGTQPCLRHTVPFKFLAFRIFFLGDCPDFCSHQVVLSGGCIFLLLVFPTTLANLGILSSCSRVLTMQCWKSPIPRPLSTRLNMGAIFFSLCRQKQKTHDSARLPSKIKAQRQVKIDYPKFLKSQQNLCK